jgi:hypothetical protein
MASRAASERRIFSKLEPDCLYPDDAELGMLLLGKDRAHRFPEIVMIEERHGFPRMDPLYGGRSWFDIVAFYERRRMEGLRLIQTQSHVEETRGETFRDRTRRPKKA